LPKITKFDLLPLLSDPKAYRLFEFLSRNVQKPTTTARLRSQVSKFTEQNIKKCESDTQSTPKSSYISLLKKTTEMMLKIESMKAKNSELSTKIKSLKAQKRVK
jgi:hypothetical protein